jgi:hypothetical protein
MKNQIFLETQKERTNIVYRAEDEDLAMES